MSAGNDRASAWAAGMAAFAEGGVWFLLLHLIAVDSAGVRAGPLDSYAQFLLLFVGATVLMTAFRRWPALPAAVPVAALALGAAQGGWWGAGGMVAITMAAALLLVAALRVVTLAVRDWREPVSASFGFGAFVLLLEIATVNGATARLLPTVVPVFFIGSLASRAASVRLDRPLAATEEEGRPSRLRRIRAPAVVLLSLVALMGLSTLLGGDGGLFQLLGRASLDVVASVIAALGYVLARIVAGPTLWLVSHLHLDFELLRRAAQNLQNIGEATRRPDAPGGDSSVERVLGFALFALIAFLLFRSIRRRFQELDPPVEPEADPALPPSHPLAPTRRFGSRGRGARRELPADTVRRWYAETLLLLEGRGIPKPLTRTPGEYLHDVTGAFPDCAPGFTALTRAYEDVRYGSKLMDEESLLRVEANRRLMMDALRGSRKVEAPEEA